MIRWCYTHEIGWYYHVPDATCTDQSPDHDPDEEDLLVEIAGFIRGNRIYFTYDGRDYSQEYGRDVYPPGYDEQYDLWDDLR